MAKKQTAPPDPAAPAAPDEGAAAFPDLEADLEQGDLLAESLNTLHLSAAEYYATLTETASHLADQARDVYETGQDYVRTHPGGLLLGALAFGVGLGLLIGRK